MIGFMKNESVRLNKYIASTGICSRRKADELIETGVIKVNGTVVNELGFLVGPKDKVTLNNEIIRPSELKYVRFYKPGGYITTADDEKARKTIYDILPKALYKLKPIGRLDKDSTGLLILTNDGDLINMLTHPNAKIPKVYRVCASKKLTVKDLEPFAKGIEIEKGKIAYADVQIVEYDGSNTILEITLYQGLNRQIRRMLEFIGSETISLKRISHANIDILGLKRGQFQFIKPKQIKELMNYIKTRSK